MRYRTWAGFLATAILSLAASAADLGILPVDGTIGRNLQAFANI